MPKLERDGVSLNYVEAGTGGPPILLVHCWGGDHSMMAPLLTHFSRSHRVISPDLRGFGASSRPEQKYATAGFGDDLVWMCRALGVERPVVIGHSMGGTIALELGARPDFATAVVILEALTVTPPPIVESFRPVLEGIRSPACMHVLQQFTEQLLGPHFEAGARARVLELFARNSPHVLASSLGELLNYDSAAAAARCKVPILYASSGPWFTDVERFRALAPQLVTSQAVGCGHYFQLEVPEQVNPAVERFLQVCVGR